MTREQREACLFDSLAVAVLRNCKRVLCHDEGVGKAGWVRSQSLASRPQHSGLFFSRLLSHSPASTPSPSHPFNLKSQGLRGTQPGTQENSGELSQGLRRTHGELMGTQGTQTTHFGELSGELRGSLPSGHIEVENALRAAGATQ